MSQGFIEQGTALESMRASDFDCYSAYGEVIDNSIQTNGTIGLRWQVNDGLAVEAYGSTAASLLDAGQLFTSNQFRWGSRLILSF